MKVIIPGATGPGEQEFWINKGEYDVDFWETKISEKDGEAHREFIRQTGATHQGWISGRGQDEELNKAIEESRERRLAFYMVWRKTQ